MVKVHITPESLGNYIKMSARFPSFHFSCILLINKHVQDIKEK